MVDVLTITSLFVSGIIISRVTGFSEWQRDVIGYQFITAFLTSTLLVLVYMKFCKVHLGHHGISFDNLNKRLDVGFTATGFLGSIGGIGFMLVAVLHLTPYDLKGALLLVGFQALALVGLIFYFGRKPSISEDKRPSVRRIYIFIGVILGFGALAIALLDISTIPAKIVFPVLFVGFGEEILFRGYIQSRLNDAFGKPYMLGGARFGLGLIIAAALFGAVHPLAAMHLDYWPWALWTFVAGLSFGYLREKTGSIIAPAIAHGVPEIFAFIFLGLGR